MPLESRAAFQLSSLKSGRQQQQQQQRNDYNDDDGQLKGEGEEAE